METKIYCPDIECDSCVRVLSRVFDRLQGINKFIIREDHIEVDYDDSLIHVDNIIQAIKDKGYRSALEPIRRKRVRDRAKEFLTDREKYKLEYTMLRGIGITFLVLAILNSTLAYYINLTDATFVGKYAWWIFYLTLSVVSIGGAMWHFKAYKAQYTCMVGMMVGMTIGMQSGMMVGFVLGVTNGFFTGALVSMILGSAVGAYTGRCCGIMGVMEGIMAGIMGGTMGPMISVMMFNDNILWFVPAYMALNTAILIGLSFMIFEEVVEENKGIIKKPMSLKRFVGISTLTLIILMGIMLLTPASIFMA